MISRFKLIVFDWDGTLMDSAARIVSSLQAAAHEVGFPAITESAGRNVIGLGMREAILMLYPGLDEAGVSRFTERYRHHFLVASPLPAKLFAGAADILEALQQQGVCLAVATGKSRNGLERSFDESATRSYFYSSRCADETCSKPDPQMLLEIMEELDVEPQKTLMVGDSVYDLEMATRAGTAALAVSYGAHERERLIKHAPLACVDSLDELRKWFGLN